MTELTRLYEEYVRQYSAMVSETSKLEKQKSYVKYYKGMLSSVDMMHKRGGLLHAKLQKLGASVKTFPAAPVVKQVVTRDTYPSRTDSVYDLDDKYQSIALHLKPILISFHKPGLETLCEKGRVKDVYNAFWSALEATGKYWWSLSNHYSLAEPSRILPML